MPFGAHEAMEVHEILTEKINMMNHFNLYAAQAKTPELKNMINRHIQEEIKSYDTVVSYTHDYQSFSPLSANTNFKSVTPDQIKYGLDNPSMLAPENNTTFNDYEIASAMLICHKNAAANGVKAALEIADPNLRQVLLNGVVNCVNQAYEVFLFMNQQGQYQIPTIKDHTAKTYLHSFQPVGESIKAQYAVNPGQGQIQGYEQPMMYGNQQMGQVSHMSTNVPMGQHMPSYSVGTNMAQQQKNMPYFGQSLPSFGQMTNPNTAGNQANMQQANHSQPYNH